MAITTTYLKIINVATGLIGLAVMGISIWGILEFQDFLAQSDFDLIESSSLYLSVAGGAMVFLISFLGFAGAACRKPNFLFGYIMLLLVAIGIQCGGLYLWWAFMGRLEEVTDSRTRAALNDQAAIEMNDGLLSTYTYCCTGCPANANTTFLGCSEDIATPVANETNFQGPYCDQSDVNNPQCAWATRCDDNAVNQSGCYIEANQLPPYAINKLVCQFLAYTDNPENATQDIVGPANNGWSCGGGDPVQYMKNIFTWFEEKETFISAGAYVTIALQVLALFFAIWAMCSARRSEHMH